MTLPNDPSQQPQNDETNDALRNDAENHTTQHAPQQPHFQQEDNEHFPPNDPYAQQIAQFMRYFQMQGPQGFRANAMMQPPPMHSMEQRPTSAMDEDDSDDSPYVSNQFAGWGSGFGGFSRWQPKKLEPWKEPETLEEKRALYNCGDRYVKYEDLPVWPEYFATEKLKKPQQDSEYTPNDALNQKIVLWKGDSTCLECDAIVNAANSSLLGGGGIDGAIHDAAGGHLREECRTLNGCSTGQTKITKGYCLPANHVLHTVGPTREDPDKLASCYTTCLDVAKANGVRSVAFCCISTGIYGYPLRKATHVALKTVREWLEQDGNADAIDRIIFVVFKFDTKEERVYRRYIPRYFPLSSYPEETAEQSDTDDETPVMRYSTFSWASWKSSSDEEYDTDSSEEKRYFEEYFKNRRHPLGEGFGSDADEQDEDDKTPGTDE